MDAPPAPPGAPLAPEEVHAVLSHLSREFGRPLEALRTALGRLDPRSPCGGDEGFDHAGSMAFVCDDLLALTGGYLDYLWIARGGRAPRFRPVRLSALLQEADRRSSPEAGPRTWLCALDGRDAEVAADAAMCGEVLARLADNALRYTPPDASIRVAAAKAGASWTMIVEDTGPGVPEADRERMFEPFARLARDVRRGIPGAGLGLALCRALVDRMGGTIAIDAPPGGGTRVIVRFSLAPG